jgi:MFS family permease
MSTPPTKFFYGWYVVLTASLGLLLGFAPIIVYCFGVFIKPLTTEFHSNRTAISFAFTLTNLMVAVCSPFVGRLADRFGPRKVIIPAAIIFGVMLIAFKFISTNLWQLYAAFIFAGIIGGAAAPVPYGKVVSNWFDKRRGLALGVTMIGIGIGAIVMPPALQRIITHLGWRGAYAIVGCAVLLISVPIIALFLKDSPQKMGLLPDGDLPSTINNDPQINISSPASPEKTGIPLREALRSKIFWLLAFGFSFIAISVHGCVIHLVPLLTDRGITPEKAALASSIVGVAVLFARLGSGYLMDRLYAPYVAAFFFGSVAVGIALLWSGLTGAAVYAAALLVGLGLGAEVDIIAYLTSRYFGLHSFGEIYGYLFAVFALAGALGPVLMAQGFDRTGSYSAPLIFFFFATITGVLLMTRLGPYRFRPHK